MEKKVKIETRTRQDLLSWLRRNNSNHPILIKILILFQVLFAVFVSTVFQALLKTLPKLSYLILRMILGSRTFIILMLCVGHGSSERGN